MTPSFKRCSTSLGYASAADAERAVPRPTADGFDQRAGFYLVRGNWWLVGIFRKLSGQLAYPVRKEYCILMKGAAYYPGSQLQEPNLQPLTLSSGRAQGCRGWTAWLGFSGLVGGSHAKPRKYATPDRTRPYIEQKARLIDYGLARKQTRTLWVLKDHRALTEVGIFLLDRPAPGKFQNRAGPSHLRPIVAVS